MIAPATLLPLSLHEFVAEPLRLMLKAILKKITANVFVWCDWLWANVFPRQLKVWVYRIIGGVYVRNLRQFNFIVIFLFVVTIDPPHQYFPRDDFHFSPSLWGLLRQRFFIRCNLGRGEHQVLAVSLICQSQLHRGIPSLLFNHVVIIRGCTRRR